MPYVKENHRKKLDPLIESISDEIASVSFNLEQPQQIGEVYFSRFYEISRFLRDLASSDHSSFSSGKSSQELAKVVYETGMEDGSFWAGDLNYSLTRIIQIVPKKLVEKKKWQKEFRYWTYSVTAGALERTALALSNESPSPNKDNGESKQTSTAWLDVVLVGVLLDIKDEYKRRVNVPYEIEQQKINGDCYDVKL